MECGRTVELEQQGSDAAPQGCRGGRQRGGGRASRSAMPPMKPSPGELLALHLSGQGLPVRPSSLSCDHSPGKVLTTCSGRPPALERNCPDIGNLKSSNCPTPKGTEHIRLPDVSFYVLHLIDYRYTVLLISGILFGLCISNFCLDSASSTS